MHFPSFLLGDEEEVMIRMVLVSGGGSGKQPQREEVLTIVRRY